MIDYRNFSQNSLAFQNRILQSINGTSYVASTQMLTFAVAGVFRMLFINPIGSGEQIVIHTLAANNDATLANLSLTKSFAGTVVYNPTTNLPTTQLTPVEQHIGGAPSQALVYADASLASPAMGGAIRTIPVIVPVNDRTVFQEEAYTLDEGTSVGVNISVNGIGTGLFKAYYYEYNK